MEKWFRAKYQPPIGLGKNGSRITGCQEHIDLSRKAATEGMVLLKNENQVLPLQRGAKVALFGKGTIDYVKGGGGSGDVTVAYTRNLYQGLKEYEQAGDVCIFEELVEFYQKNIQEQYKAGVQPGMTIEPEVPADLLQKARAYTDTAIISICRYSGEDWDRKLDKEELHYDCNPYVEEFLRKSDEVFDKGDFYLSSKEEAMAELVMKTFPNVIVVMNVGGMVDTMWFAERKEISGVLMAWQGGMEGGLAMADVLLGKANPSGHLTDTLAKKITDYPSTEVFHESLDYAEYIEDIYVGYRYFETIPGAAEQVNYPFGFGLSYTEFQMEIADCHISTDEDSVRDADVSITKDSIWDADIRITVEVTNVGNYAGKYVAQLYYAAPQGKLGKAARELGAFIKTRLLEPGESQRIFITMPLSRMASYDDLGKVAKSAYVMEAGEYRWYLGENVRDAVEIKKYSLAEDIVVEQLSEKCKPYRLSRRLQADGSYQNLDVTDNPADPCILDRLPNDSFEGTIPEVMAEPARQRLPWLDYPEHNLVEVAEGKLSMEEFMEQLSLEELIHLTGGHRGTGVTNTGSMGGLNRLGVPTINTADGPAGLRIQPECQVNTTAFPCATMMACTWNTELVEQVAVAGAREVKENNIGLWLTPAVNIHRSPLCGRNFEYYSEDPYLSGMIGAALVRGMQSQYIGASVKHFVCNNKETNRKDSDSIVSERALREIYLKAFEIIVKEASPWTIMSSYNIMNGCKVSENKELLTDILRGEWNYDGMVTSDWWNHSEQYLEIKAGNDIKMMNGYPERVKEAYERGELSLDEIKTSARRVLEMVLKQE